MMNMTRRRFLEVAGMSVAFVVAACAGTTSISQSIKRGGMARLSLAAGGTSLILDPAAQVNEPDGIVNGLLYQGLLRLRDDWSLEPQLATSWSSDANLQTWTFKLRPGVTFHDGQPLTADDVVYSLRRVLDPKVGSAIYSRLASEMTSDGITAVDVHTVAIALQQPDSFLPLALGARHAAIVRSGTTKFDTANGTGPYKLDAVDQQQLTFKLIRNPNYWVAGLPYLDGIQGAFSNDQQSLIQSVSNGTFDFGGPIDPSAAAAIQAGRVHVLRHAQAQFDNLVMDPTVKPFNDKRVRDAIKLALNRDQMVQIAYHGFATTGQDVPVRSSDPLYAPALRQRHRDVEQAKALLASAGYPTGLDLKLITADAGPAMKDFGVVVVQGLADAGIRITIDQRPADTYWDKVWLHEPFYVSNWVLRHPLDAMTVEFASNAAWNEAKFISPDFDALLAAAKSAKTAADQKSALVAAQLMIEDQAGWVNPGWFDELWVAKAGLSSVTFNPTHFVNLETAQQA